MTKKTERDLLAEAIASWYKAEVEDALQEAPEYDIDYQDMADIVLETALTDLADETRAQQMQQLASLEAALNNKTLLERMRALTRSAGVCRSCRFMPAEGVCYKLAELERMPDPEADYGRTVPCPLWAGHVVLHCPRHGPYRRDRGCGDCDHEMLLDVPF
jgi:hypothetical protein